jgi:hypothetical protein
MNAEDAAARATQPENAGERTAGMPLPKIISEQIKVKTE